MVFWSSFSKKIRDSINKITFDLLKARVDRIEGDYATKTYTDAQNQAQDLKIDANTTNITNNTNDITALDTKVDGVITGLQDGNLINYTGVYNSTTTYRLAQATAHNDLWYVSNVDNNLGHTPTGSSDAFWERISAPVVNLQPYLLKTDAAALYAGLNKTNYFLAPQYIKGSLSLGADNSTPRIEIDGENRRISAASGRIQYQNCATPTLSDDCANKEYVDNNFYTKTQINNWDLQTYSGTLTQLLVGPQKGDTTGTGGFPIYKYAFKTSIKFTEQDWSNFCVLDFRFVNATRQWVYVNPLFVFLDNGYINIEFITLDPNCYQTNTGAQVQIRVIKNSSYIG